MNSMGELLQQLRSETLHRDSTDGELLDEYLRTADESVLASLVYRHGSMVWGVCRRILDDYHDAEDAFQATFLVLVRRADSIEPKEMVGNWLYGVAHQTASKARQKAVLRRTRESQVAEPPEPPVWDRVSSDDLRPILDHELSRLPENYRAVVVLCDLEGITRKEAARRLAIPEGTVSGWLSRARSMLAARLSERGVTLTGGTLAALLSQNVASASVPNSAAIAMIGAATQFAVGHTVAVGTVSSEVVVLANEVLKTMKTSKLGKVVSVAIIGFLTLGTTLLWATLADREEEPGNVPGQTEQERILGRWSVQTIEGVSGNTPESLKVTKLEPTGYTWIIERNQVIHEHKSKDGKVRRKTYKITLDTSKKPQRLTLHTKDFAIRYIYEVKGDTLRLCCFSLGEQDGKKIVAWPTEFSLDKHRPKFPRLEVLRRVNFGGKKKGQPEDQNK